MAFSNKERQKSPAKRFLSILGVAFFLMYLALGVAIIFWKDIPLDMEPRYRIMFGVLLIVYSFFRFMRLLQTRD